MKTVWLVITWASLAMSALVVGALVGRLLPKIRWHRLKHVFNPNLGWWEEWHEHRYSSLDFKHYVHCAGRRCRDCGKMLVRRELEFYRVKSNKANAPQNRQAERRA